MFYAIYEKFFANEGKLNLKVKNEIENNSNFKHPIFI